MFEIAKTIYRFIELFFLCYLIGYTFFLVLSVTVGSVSLYELKRRNELFNVIERDYYVPVSIIVPAFNEELTIVETVRSLLYLDYRLYEIIVVDDGSTDGTSRILKETFGLEQITRPIRKRIPCQVEMGVFSSYDHKVPITLITKKNSGKADSLNLGVNASEYPWVVCTDADSMLQSDSLEKMARPITRDDEVIAVGGLVRIINDVTVKKGKVIDYKLPKKLVLCMQVLEYDRSFLASRLLFDKFNGNLIVSGAFGLFKKEILVGVGGYDSSTVGEDMELIVRMHAFARANKMPYKIKYAADSVCWSQAPSTLHDLRIQRRRWQIGLFDSIRKHREVLLNPSFGLLSLISFTYYILYELYSPYIETFGLLSIVGAIFIGIINVPYMLMLLGIYMLLSMAMTLTAFFSRVHAMDIKLKRRDIFKAIGVAAIENIGLRFVLLATRFAAIFGKGKDKLAWGKIKRYRYKNYSTRKGRNGK